MNRHLAKTARESPDAGVFVDRDELVAVEARDTLGFRDLPGVGCKNPKHSGVDRNIDKPTEKIPDGLFLAVSDWNFFFVDGFGPAIVVEDFDEADEGSPVSVLICELDAVVAGKFGEDVELLLER